MAAIVGVAAAVLLVLLASGLLVSVRRPFANMFAYRSDPWPQGVQEDDEFQWRWSGDAASLPAAPSETPELSSIEDGSAPVSWRGRVRGRRTRFRV